MAHQTPAGSLPADDLAQPSLAEYRLTADDLLRRVAVGPERARQFWGGAPLDLRTYVIACMFGGAPRGPTTAGRSQAPRASF
jgi:hypothetical protein